MTCNGDKPVHKIEVSRCGSCHSLILFIGTSKDPGIVPRAVNVLFNSIRDRQSECCRLKPDMVTQVVELDDKALKQEIVHKQQIMSWSQNKNHVSLCRMVTSAVRLS